jgi:putative ABC transport system permease protein
MDLLVFPIAALWQQKSRTALTTLGVVFGAFVLAASLSINHGVQETISRESRRTDALRRINVHPHWGGPASTAPAEDVVVEGQMSDAKRARIRRALIAHKNSTGTAPQPVLLTEETLHKLAALEHVQAVEPVVSLWGFIIFDGQSLHAGIQSAKPLDPPYLKRLTVGRFFESDAETAAVVSEFLLYRWGLVDDAAVEAALGKKLRIEIHSRRNPTHAGLHVYLSRPVATETTREETALLAKLSNKLPAVLDKLDLTADELDMLRQTLQDTPAADDADVVSAEEFTIVGVIRQSTEEEFKERRWWDEMGGYSDVFLPCQTAASFFLRVPEHRATGISQATLIADDEEHVKQIVQEVKDIGLQGDAPIEFIERERLTWRLVFGGMTCIAAVALLVAAMGIANTMLMSVLERTREIGVMKAVGAAGSHIQAIFLIEGGLIGTVGGGLGLLLAWGASFPGDAWVRSMVERDMNVKLQDSLFVFPPWLVATVIVFAFVVTTCAALYPARRAANVDPVAALRHE